jgi:hypothetical protein
LANRFSDHFLDEADPQSLMNYVRRLKLQLEQQGLSFVDINIFDILPPVITNIINQGSTGDVVGPASAVDGNIAVFDTTTGKLIADSGIDVAALTAGGGGGEGFVIGDTESELANLVTYSDASGLHVKDLGIAPRDVFGSPQFLFLSNEASPIGGYKKLVNRYEDAATSTLSASFDSGDGNVVLGQFSTEAINFPVIGSGTWDVNFWLSSTSLNNMVGYVTSLFIEWKTRTSGGIETSISNILFQLQNSATQHIKTLPSQIIFGGAVSAPQYVDPTDTIILRFTVSTTQATTANVTLSFGSSDCPSFLRIPTPLLLNDFGDMLKSVYDPNSVEADAFDTDNHVDGDTNGVYTLAERSKLAGIEAGADVTDATNVSAAGAIMGTLLTERGSVIFRDTSAPAELLHGNSGQVLTSGGHGADPSWQDASGGLTHPQIMARISIGF